MNLYKNDGNRKLYRWRETVHDLKHTTSVKHVGGSAMACACMAAIGTGTLVFYDDLTAGRSSRMNCEVCRAVLSAQSQPNTCKNGIFFNGQIGDMISTQPRHFSVTEGQTDDRETHLKLGKPSVMSMGSRLHWLYRIFTKIIKTVLIFQITLVCRINFELLKMETSV